MFPHPLYLCLLMHIFLTSRLWYISWVVTRLLLRYITVESGDIAHGCRSALIGWRVLSQDPSLILASLAPPCAMSLLSHTRCIQVEIGDTK